MNKDEQYITRAFDLAANGLGHVSPNPMVGCVIVHNDKIIGEGWHKKYGEAHAEVNAINSVKDQSLLPEATVYVTLEPCSHFGKTPPCADLLVKHKVKRVVIANIDSNPLVGGKGVKKLEDAGIEVITGILEDKGWEVNKRFFTTLKHKRPYIILKWAQTQDGFVARKNYDSKWISNESSRKMVHKWRSEEDAIMVGTNTVEHDNPKLNVRSWEGRNPVRIVIDKRLRLDKELALFDGSQPTICYNLMKDEENHHLTFVQLDENNFLEALLHDLYDRNLHSLIVEGGSLLLNNFIEKGLWNEALVFISPQQFEEGIAAPAINGLVETQQVAEDQLLIFKNLKNG
ncbi:bifunctional diaminohydroxyphosphoribosylaminopyrimidine deaminase/5-amino-6-(5-phosphoribosylamino)uracil reductase RibD [Fulvivirga ligni]|uniref:bifunctional diaminohydroxyphosphoribosylaminopyrimidine deaminase/5-amino-6-(5-phosphoribosylamino)uracil reductase RibD n=1 Tax=Fulvivirga ligni TaxID=2904246 RepID=UPI001EFFA639|nr:bifunctional diaminohydroxyphosphoribosylaminopyrimidine deaminase/5-amino-6-(5-phosphoribosylamino)uracil reductase RibD [Fulvivirga ligni]UII22629.1 bifunctional diaminohydroxyphosphoribosylaminopyrimidine deaminase/5-amino-6-(5-phosphoribosylamino)uracil reductase RibD [Fulvivirga ligni]